MKTETNFIDYGVYMDRKCAFIISLNRGLHEELIREEEQENEASLPRSTKVTGQEEHLQNTINNQLKKFCKLIISKLSNAHTILVFGPSVSKFELQKELREDKQLKHIPEEMMVSVELNKEEALRFVTNHYAQKA